MLLLMCTSLLLLTSCGEDKTAQNNGKLAWAASGRTDIPSTVSYMHFNSAEALNTSIARPSGTVALVPMSGYAYFFGPKADAASAFQGLELFFVSADGKQVNHLSYDDLYATFEASQDSSYLDAANYVAALYMDCLNTGKPLSKDERVGTWYSFTSAQIKDLTKQ